MDIIPGRLWATRYGPEDFSIGPIADAMLAADVVVAFEIIDSKAGRIFLDGAAAGNEACYQVQLGA